MRTSTPPTLNLLLLLRIVCMRIHTQGKPCSDLGRVLSTTLLSGGMDQAISIMGQSGVAALVDFHPLRATAVHLPAGAAFLIGNCLAVSNKVGRCRFTL